MLSNNFVIYVVDLTNRIVICVLPYPPISKSYPDPRGGTVLLTESKLMTKSLLIFTLMVADVPVAKIGIDPDREVVDGILTLRVVQTVPELYIYVSLYEYACSFILYQEITMRLLQIYFQKCFAIFFL